MTEPAPRAAKPLLIKLAVAAVLLLAAAALVARGLDVKALAAQGLEFIRSAGPVVFFAGMALLPAVGAPMLVFLLPAVSLFGPRFGAPATVLLGLGMILANMTLTYALARWTLRPPLLRLMARLGYKAPVVGTADATDLIVVLRMTPGFPFCVQNYLLGLANVAFGRFVWVSCLLAWPQAVAFMLFGDALLHGKGRLALITLGLLLAVMAVLHAVRRRYAKKKAAA